uniref:Uncharacterized protein n=1 Tax=Setaria italica TaxID=4555 RepID=K3ZYL6_SETIT
MFIGLLIWIRYLMAVYWPYYLWSFFTGERNWLEDGMNSPDYKGTVVRYLLYHKLNEVPLPKEFPQPLPKESNEPLNNMPVRPF